MSGQHAKLSPSSSERWLTCPGSVRLIDALDVTDKGSRFAAEGTAAHEVHEQCLKHELLASDFIGETIEADGYDIEVTEEMAEAVQQSLDYIAANQPDEMIVEKWVSLKHLGVPGLDGGTSDAILMNKQNKKITGIEVVDYKHGKGVKVYPRDNTQMMCYGSAVIHEIDPEGKAGNVNITLTVSQPRLNHIDSWTITRKELQKWIKDTLIPGGKRTLDEDAPLVPSDKGCRFCPVKPTCPALYEKTTELAVSEFEEFALPPVETLTSEQKANIVKYKDLISDFFKEVEKAVAVEIKKGSKDYVKQLKMVRKKTQSRLSSVAFDDIDSPLLDYIDEDELYKTEKKPKGIGDIKKTLKEAGKKPKEIEAIMKEVTEKPEGDLIVVPSTDARKAVPVGYVADFDGLEDTD